MFVDPFINHWAMELPLLPIMSDTALNISIQVLVSYIFNFLGYINGRGIVGTCVDFMFKFLRK